MGVNPARGGSFSAMPYFFSLGLCYGFYAVRVQTNTRDIEVILMEIFMFS